MASSRDETGPLLPSDQRHIRYASQDFIAKNLTETNSAAHRLRKYLQRFLTSKYGHYFVVVLVSLDVCGIFASFLITLHMCEHAGQDLRMWQDVNDALDILSLLFSCLFMIELLCSIFAFGLRYFVSKFHIFDALSIIASFLVDILTHGPLEEVGSLVIVLRLFRVFKIIEESSTVAEESVSELQGKIAELERENASLRQRHVGLTAATEGSEVTSWP